LSCCIHLLFTPSRRIAVLVKFRIVAKNEQQGDYILTAFLIWSATAGSSSNGQVTCTNSATVALVFSEWKTGSRCERSSNDELAGTTTKRCWESENFRLPLLIFFDLDLDAGDEELGAAGTASAAAEGSESGTDRAREDDRALSLMLNSESRAVLTFTS
jgi:hypothetical protein